MTKKEKDKLNLIDKKRLEQEAKQKAHKEKVRKKAIEIAHELYTDGTNDIEVDDDAEIINSGTSGVWVQAWLYVGYDGWEIKV